MIDVSKERLLPLSKACRLVPPSRGRRPVSPSTLYRWITAGVLSRSGHRIHLEAVDLPSGLRTSGEALARFYQALSVPLQAESPALPRAPAARRRAAERAERELAKARI
jgi:hypothetical protein